MNKIFGIVSLCMVTVFLGACSSSNQIGNQTSNTATATALPAPTETIQPTAPSSPTLIPTRIPPPTPTARFVPTLSQDLLGKNLAVINDPDCILPCYFGIIPGKTTLDQANKILIDNGWQVDGVRRIFTLENDEIASVHSIRLYDFENISQNLLFYVHDNIIVGMRIGMGNIRHSLFLQYIARFFPVEIFKRLGMPDEIYAVDSRNNYYDGNSIVVYYEKLGLWIRQSGFRREDTQVCTNQSSEVIYSLVIEVYDPAYSNMPQVIKGSIQWTIDLWGSIENVIGISRAEFVSNALQNDEICYQRVNEGSP